MRRGLAIWLVLLAAYAAAFAIRGGSEPSRAEQHRLLVADSIADDHDLNVANQLREPHWKGLRPSGRVINGRQLEPAGIGTPLFVAAPYALGGATAAALWCAAWLALAFALAAVAARRVVPDPWATWAALGLGLSPAALAAATTIAPEAPVAALATGAALLALRTREEPRTRLAVLSATLLAPVFWLSVRAIPLTLALAGALVRWLRRRQRGLATFLGIEVLVLSAVVYLSLNDRLYDGAIPTVVHDPGKPLLGDLAARLGSLPGVLGDLLLRAPVVVLAAAGVFLLWRSRRDRLAVIASTQTDVEVTAQLAVVAFAAALLTATFAHPQRPPFLAPDLVPVLPLAAGLVAWGWRFAPRPAGPLLVLLTAASAAEYLL